MQRSLKSRHWAPVSPRLVSLVVRISPSLHSGSAGLAPALTRPGLRHRRSQSSLYLSLYRGPRSSVIDQIEENNQQQAARTRRHLRTFLPTIDVEGWTQKISK